MTDESTEVFAPARRGRVECAVTTLAAASALLLLDNQLGPVSFAFRRAVAATVLATLAALRWIHKSEVAAVEIPDGSRAVLPSEAAMQRSSVPRNFGWSIAPWAAVIAALAVVMRAPSVPLALVAYVVALAAIEIDAESRSSGNRLAPGLVPVCLSYVGIRFAVDLVPQAGWIAETVARGAGRYINLVRQPISTPASLSFTVLGGPAVEIAVLYLLWSWRRAGGIERISAAAIVPLAWFALLPAVTPKVEAGAITAFSKGAYHGLVWLGVAAFVGARGREHPGPSGPRDVGKRQLAALSPQTIAAGLAAALVGACLVGTAFIGPAAGRSVRVYNHGGLDWERPVFGQFGAFSGGMFGLLPVYCRAEGYDFDVIDTAETRAAAEAPKPKAAATEGGRASPGAQSLAARKPPEVPNKPKAAKTGSDGASTSRTTAQSKVRPPTNQDPAKDLPSHPRTSSDRASPSRTTAPVQAVAPAKDTIEPADLEKTRILVLINSPKVWDERERRTIYDFVARGGSLLVLGDHTDVFGLMRGFNSLLGPLGIQFRFDSAYHVREGWRGCLAAAPDAVAWGWDDENPGVAVGASLELSGSARPLLVGRYGFSDSGVRENVIGSYLGNYHYDAGEPLGDVVLVATATIGRGRVVVWGDTSAFQSVSACYPAVVGPMLAWLSRPAAWTERPPARSAAAIGLLAAIVWLWLIRGGTREAAVVATGLLIGLAVPWCLGLANHEARVTVNADVVLFDRSHLPAIGHYDARVNPIGPLYTNLLRSGFRVTAMEDWHPAAIGRAKAVAFVAPQRPFTPAEVKDLLNAEERGAVVILTTSQPDSAGARRLLDAHGLTLVPRPLGTVSPADPAASRRERETHPRFMDAWPVVTSEGGNPVELPGVEAIYQHGRDVVALFRRVGKGGLLLIADTRFFSDMNVEDTSSYSLGNLALIDEVFQRYLGADPDAVKPLFRSPVKPQ